MMKRFRTMAWVFLVVWLIPLAALAQEKLSVGVAANYISAFKELAADFEAKTKIKVEGTFTSSGNLYSQIIHGAPYDLFLSADESRPIRLHKEGHAEAPFVYARGQAVLWSARQGFCQAVGWQAALKSESVKKIAIANPKTAPYGNAAMVALQKAGLWEGLQNRLVTAQDIAQAFQYASSASVDAGFCALSATLSPEGKKGCFYEVPEAPDIVQGACILKRTKNLAQVERLVAFLSSPEALKIKAKYGYR